MKSKSSPHLVGTKPEATIAPPPDSSGFTPTEQQALAELRRSPEFRAYLEPKDLGLYLDGVDVSTQSADFSGNTGNTEEEESATDFTTFHDGIDPPEGTPFVYLYSPCVSNAKKISSLKPNLSLMAALIDDSATGAEDHKCAVDIMEAWVPHPWKGQIWKARRHEPNSRPERVWIAPCVDGIWSGNEWLPYVSLPVINKPLRYPEPSKASIRLVELFQKDGTIKIADQELNSAYDAYESDPDEEFENLKLTIAAYVRSPARVAQYRKLMKGMPELAMQENDVFMDFIQYVLAYLPSYKHDPPEPKLNRWITMLWHKSFFPKIKTRRSEFTNNLRFMNHVGAGDVGYQHLSYTVDATKMSTETVHDESRERFIREMINSTRDDAMEGNPTEQSPYSRLSVISKLMLQGALRGETTTMAAKRQGITTQHALRRMKAAMEEVQAITRSLKPAPIDEDNGEGITLMACAENYLFAGRGKRVTA
ncbi:hypothetical protein BH10ACI4_BH10ACI4_16980 [soil metagenome]